MKRLILAAALICASASPAWAQFDPQAAAPAPSLNIVQCPDGATSATEAADEAIVTRALNAFGRGGYGVLSAHLPALREVMSRAPACYPLIERRQDQIIVRAEADEFAVISAALAGTVEQEIMMRSNGYGVAALLLGSFAVETHDYEGAINWLDQGLARQPDNLWLLGERSTALLPLRRFQEAYDVYVAALNNPAVALTIDRPLFIRRTGIVLIDLGRLDEAEAAFHEVLRQRPDDDVSRNELVYIAGLRAGAPALDIEITAPNAPPSKPPI